MLDKRAKRIPESLETLTILRTLTGTVHRGRIDISSFAVTGWTGEARQSPSLFHCPTGAGMTEVLGIPIPVSTEQP